MQKSKIDWCDMTWNPVTGCLNGCEYCYARRIAERFCTSEFKEIYECFHDCAGCAELNGPEYIGCQALSARGKEVFPYGFLPTFYNNRLDEPQRIKKPQNIFVCSMADLFGEWVPDAWIQQVFEACEKAPLHRYLFLTRNPQNYCKIAEFYGLPVSNKYFFGTTNAKRGEASFKSYRRNTFLSIEPVMEDIGQIEMKHDWVIVGAETGNRKGRIIPERKWISDIVDQCRAANVPVFLKNSLRDIWGEDLIKEYPW